MAELSTARLLLRPWNAGDVEAIVRHANNRSVARNLRDRFPHPYTRDEAERWVALCSAVEGPTLDFAIVYRGEAIGSVGLMPNTDVYRCTLELGYWLAEPFWGRGLASEAVAAVVPYAFASFPELRAVQARHFSSNPASGRVLARCGFQPEGCLRQGAIKDGVVMDVLVYSRLRDEAPAAGQGAAAGALESSPS